MYACPAGESVKQRIYANTQRLLLLTVKCRDYETLDPCAIPHVGQRLTRRTATDIFGGRI